MNFDEWLNALRDEVQQEDGLLDYAEGRWKVRDRRRVWWEFGARVFDSHLEVLKISIVEVLGELDPRFDLEPEQRYAASVHGKVLRHSNLLREGVAATVALLGNEGAALRNCSRNKPDAIALLVTRALFEKKDWRIWASINHLLPTIAEGAPGEFLDAVQAALLSDEAPFDELFRQEGDGVFGANYMSGLLWALEGLAWSDDYLVRAATLLAELAARDPGGKWSNRPDNSLVAILLPWHPQTFATFEKQLACLRAVRNDHPEVAWSVLIRLLPNQHQTTSGTHKPSWFMNVPEEWQPSVSRAEYYEKAARYAEMAVEMALSDLGKLTDLVGELDNLPKASFEQVVGFLSSDDVKELDEGERLSIWTKIERFVRKHRRFQDAKWALPMDVVERLEDVAKSLMPESLEGRFQHLFSNNDFDLYEEDGDWEAQSRLLDEKRQQAIAEMWSAGDLDRIVQFAQATSSPYRVGWAFGKVADRNAEANMLPAMLETKGESMQFVEGFVSARYFGDGFEWLERLSLDRWSVNQKCQLLTCLPFDDVAWVRAAEWLGNQESLYWKHVVVNPYPAKGDLTIAVDKLLEYGRPIAALDCLHVQLQNGSPLDHSRIIKTLLAAASSEEPRGSLNRHHALELIKALQDDGNTNSEGLFKVEWAYVSLLDGHQNARPKLLEQRLADDPEFFCEAIRLIYRPQGIDLPDDVDETSRAIATNAWRLLHEWNRPPGMDDDGSFSRKRFLEWLEAVKRRCTESGHLDVALIKIGEVLFYCPEDPGGLWIDDIVARQLNASDAEKMRDGFRTEVFNSRGVHWVDPTGQPERDLAQRWREKATAAEEAGYARFGATLRQLADSYDREADRVIADHASED